MAKFIDFAESLEHQYRHPYNPTNIGELRHFNRRAYVVRPQGKEGTSILKLADKKEKKYLKSLEQEARALIRALNIEGVVNIEALIPPYLNEEGIGGILIDDIHGRVMQTGEVLTEPEQIKFLRKTRSELFTAGIAGGEYYPFTITIAEADGMPYINTLWGTTLKGNFKDPNFQLLSSSDMKRINNFVDHKGLSNHL